MAPQSDGRFDGAVVCEAAVDQLHCQALLGKIGERTGRKYGEDRTAAENDVERQFRAAPDTRDSARAERRLVGRFVRCVGVCVRVSVKVKVSRQFGIVLVRRRKTGSRDDQVAAQQGRLSSWRPADWSRSAGSSSSTRSSGGSPRRCSSPLIRFGYSIANARLHPLAAGERILEEQKCGELDQWQADETDGEHRGNPAPGGANVAALAREHCLTQQDNDADECQTPSGRTRAKREPKPDVVHPMVMAKKPPGTRVEVGNPHLREA